MMGWLSSASEGARRERMNNVSGRAFIRTPLAPDKVLDVQLQVALAAEDLGPRHSLRELRRIIVRVQDVLDVADVTLTLLEPHGWQLLAVRFDDEVAVILRRHATAAQVVAELDACPPIFGTPSDARCDCVPPWTATCSSSSSPVTDCARSRRT